MKRMSWLFSIVVIIIGLLAGSCGDGDERHETLTLLFWQAPSIANPYLSSGTKDIDAATLVLEPLANYDEDADLVPRLAEAIPTVANGGLSQDRTTLTWRLKAGLLWSDGSPLTAHDAEFTYGYACSLPNANCEANNVEAVRAIDDLTLEITFAASSPYPYTLFVGQGSYILQKAQFEDCMGDAARQGACQEKNLYPVGTGPYQIVEFDVNDSVFYEANDHFREPGQPFFTAVTIQGGGDAEAAARAVLETGEADYGWNLQVDSHILQALQDLGRGMLVNIFGSNVESLVVNFTEPESSVDPHPFLSDPAVREALSLAIDRDDIAALYGEAARPTCNVITAPAQYVSPNNDACLMQDMQAARTLLDDAGWLPGDDGIREKDGVRLSVLYQTSTNPLRQDTQALIQGWWRDIGIETELKNIAGSVFFGGDPDNPDTYQRFHADVQMYTNGPDVDPQAYLARWRSIEIPTAANMWRGGNDSRWVSETYDDAYEALTMTPIGPEREELVIEMNDLVVQNYVVIPLVQRALVSAFSNRLKGIRLSPWDSDMSTIHEWYRE